MVHPLSNVYITFCTCSGMLMRYMHCLNEIYTPVPVHITYIFYSTAHISLSWNIAQLIGAQKLSDFFGVDLLSLFCYRKPWFWDSHNWNACVTSRINLFSHLGARMCENGDCQPKFKVKVLAVHSVLSFGKLIIVYYKVCFMVFICFLLSCSLCLLLLYCFPILRKCNILEIQLA